MTHSKHSRHSLTQSLKQPHPLARDIAGEKQNAEGEHESGGAKFDGAYQHASVAGRFVRDALRQRLGADRERRNGPDRDRGAQSHHEGRGDTGPKQALREREYEHDDSSGARPQTDGYHRGQTALPATWPGQLLRLRTVGMSPWQYVQLLAVMVMAVMVAVPEHVVGLADLVAG